MIPNKSILLVGHEDGELASIIPELKGLCYSGVLSSNVEKALEVITAFKNLTLVIIDSAMMGVDQTMITRILKIQASLPIIWLSHSRQNHSDELAHPALACLQSPVDPTELRSTLTQLLFEHYYDAELVKSLHQVSSRVLERHSALTSTRAPFIRTNPRVLGNTAAILTFTGGGIYGQLSLAGSGEYFISLHRRLRLLERASLSHDGHDLIAEIVNQVTGELRQNYFAARGLNFTLSPPFTMSGTDVELEFKGHKPSLVIPFDEGEHSVYVEFNYASSAPPKSPVKTATVPVDGEITFF
jgi:CheY-specific phosphatase CheX